ncbi:MAG: hypothetical protein GF419_02270 [Ignavibacteriales bacterium]|nr:hypothetical protein [Ignavibacteriales bacterium]
MAEERKKSGCLKTVLVLIASIIGFVLFLGVAAMIVFALRSGDEPLDDGGDIDYELTEQAPPEDREPSETEAPPAEEAIVSAFRWKFVDSRARTRTCDLTLKILKRDVADAMARLEEIGETSVEDLGVDPALARANQTAYQRALWREIFRRVRLFEDERFEKIARNFERLFRRDNLAPPDRVRYLFTFVQNIRYQRPGGTFDLLPPTATLARRFGDCDTKSILLLILYEKLRLVPCELLWSHRYAHVMLGVAAPASGDFLRYKGGRYFFLETTYPGWEIGELPPDVNDPSAWRVVDLDP